MKPAFLFFLMLMGCISCLPARVNQYHMDGKVQRRTGKWVESNSSEEGLFVSRGKYREGEKIGVWKTTLEGRLYQKDKIRNHFITTKFYYPTGIVRSKGRSATVITKHYKHWFYTGKWRYFDRNGKIEYIKIYHQGSIVDSISYR